MRTIKFLLAILFSIAIAACGGGGNTTTATTYSISGTVTSGGVAKSGVTVKLTGAATATVTTDASGNYSFAGLANGTYTVTPSLTAYAFSPTSTVVSVSGANVTGKNFTATAAATTYSISGSVSGAATSGVTIALGGANTGSVVTDGSGNYTLSGLVAGSYTVTPSLSGYTFSPTSAAVTITAANVTGTNFTAMAVPVPHALSGNVSPTLAGVTISVTGTATATTTTDASGNYTVNLYDGSYTVTPSKTGYMFTPNSAAITMNGAAQTQNFAGTANSSVIAPVSGTVSGAWLEGVTITMSGGASGTTTTNASGNYSFNLASGASYTFTPSLSGYTYAPASQTVNITAGSSAAVAVPNMVASSAIASNSLSGTISYGGAKTGPVFVRVYQSCTGCTMMVAGTQIALTSGSGTYTIKGIQNTGSYVVVAEMDTLGNGQPNASNPAGSTTATLSTTPTSLTGINIAVTDPGTVTPVAPTLQGVSPASGAAFVQYNPPMNANNQEIATSYKVYWGTDTNASIGGSSATFPAQGQNDTFYFLKGLTDGSKFYFKMTALVGATESATSAVTAQVTIGATTGANTVSGSVSFPGTATGPMIVGLYNETTQAVYFTTYASPASPQSYSIAGAPAGNYFPFAIIDMNNNGRVDTGDLSNTNGNGSAIAVNSNMTNNLTLTAAYETAFVYTDHWTDGTNNDYNLNLGTNDGTKRAVAVTLYSGPNNAAVPYDMGAANGNWSWMGLGTTAPYVGDTYWFKVTFSDGTTQNISASVTAVLGSANMPTSLVVNTATPYNRNVPQFTWAAPSSAPAAPYVYHLNVWGADTNWWYPQNNGLLSTTLSAVYDVDGTATISSLTTGTPYTWQVQVQDANNNSATFQAPPYTP